MKKNLHPDNYRPVVFQDLNDGTTFITRSTVDAEETITLDGVEYPLVKVHISSSSHPFFTGQEKLVDVEGRVDKFKARREAAEKAKAARLAKTAAKKVKPAVKKADSIQLTDDSNASASEGKKADSIQLTDDSNASASEGKKADSIQLTDNSDTNANEGKKADSIQLTDDSDTNASEPEKANVQVRG